MGVASCFVAVGDFCCFDCGIEQVVFFWMVYEAVVLFQMVKWLIGGV